jgi:hypothetical protein
MNPAPAGTLVLWCTHARTHARTGGRSQTPARLCCSHSHTPVRLRICALSRQAGMHAARGDAGIQHDASFGVRTTCTGGGCQTRARPVGVCRVRILLAVGRVGRAVAFLPKPTAFAHAPLCLCRDTARHVCPHIFLPHPALSSVAVIHLDAQHASC